MKHGDIFSFHYDKIISLETPIHNLIFPYPRILAELFYINYDFQNFSKTLNDLLFFDIKNNKIMREYALTQCHNCSVSISYHKITPTEKIGNFKMGEYPFLDKEFWNKIGEEYKVRKIIRGKMIESKNDYCIIGAEGNVLYERRWSECRDWAKNNLVIEL